MNFRAKLLFLAPVIALALTSCETNNAVVSLDYQPGLGQTLPGPKVVAIGRFADMRREGDFNIGLVCSPIGNVMDTISTRVPVAVAVSNGFAHGLKARGMLTEHENAAYVITGEIIEFRAEQYIHPSSAVSIRVNLVRSGSGEILHSRVYQSSREGDAYSPGSGDPVPNLTDIASRALQNIIDQSLDDSQFRRRINASAPAYNQQPKRD